MLVIDAVRAMSCRAGWGCCVFPGRIHKSGADEHGHSMHRDGFADGHAGGGTVTFACDGTVTLAHTITNTVSVLLDGSGHQVTISGNGTVGIFEVCSNVDFSVQNLTFANGSATAGAAILNLGGNVSVTNGTFCGNKVLGTAAPSYPHAGGESVGGGAVANQGVLKLVNCTFTNNSAVG